MSESPSSDSQEVEESRKNDIPLEQLDPAILSSHQRFSRHRYSVSELKDIRDRPASKRVPTFFDPRMNYWRRPGRNGDDDQPPQRDTRRERSNNYDSNGSSNSRSDNGGRRNNEGKESRAERLKKEDSIILSPQRRSFNMGCQMPAAPNSQPPLGPAFLRNDRDILNGSRRIGSGRIVSRDVSWDYRPESKKEEPTEFFQRGNSGSQRDREGFQFRENFERRGGDFENSPEKEPRVSSKYLRSVERARNFYASRNPPNDRRRQYSEGKDEEPEWFSGGPTSQHDTIELHGFDEPGEERKEHSKDSKASDMDFDFEERKEEEKPAKQNDSNNNKDLENGTNQALGDVLSNKLNEDDFNFEEFLNIDSITGLLASNQEQAQMEAGGGSRFSQWFKRESPTKQHGGPRKQQFDSRRSSLHDELNNLIDFNPEMMAQGAAINKPSSDSNKYFTPISPAANTSGIPRNFLEILQQNSLSQAALEKLMQEKMRMEKENRSGFMQLMEQKGRPSGPSGLNSPSLSQMPSVEELEARLRQGGNAQLSPNPSVPRIITSNSAPMMGGSGNQDVAAFKRLLAGMQNNDGPAVNPMIMNSNPQTIQQQIQQQNLIQMLSKPNPQAAPGGGGAMNSEELKQMFSMMKNMQGAPQAGAPPGRPIQGQKPPPPPNEILPGAPPSMLHPLQHPQIQPDLRQAEILKRPEAQMVIQSLIRGDVKQQALWQQLANPATTPRQREMLNAVLAAVNATPRGNSPSLLIPPGGAPIPIPPLTQADLQVQLLLQQQQKQQMRLSPLPNAFTVPPVMANNPLTLHVPGMPQRIPSPRELQYHTQSIMQNALIRKKLEEQRENFRKRQEAQAAMQDGSSQSNSGAPVTTTTTLSSSDGQQQPPILAPKAQQPVASVQSSIGGPQPPSSMPNPPSHTSPVKHTASPTPLAFTPTSVLRKMTAEKEADGTANGSSGVPMGMNCIKSPQNPNNPLLVLNQSMASMSMAGKMPTPQMVPQMAPQTMRNPVNSPAAWLSQLQQQAALKPQGRPIVKNQTGPQPGSFQDFPALTPQQQQQQQQVALRKQQANVLMTQMQAPPQQQQQQPQQTPNPTAQNTGMSQLTAHQIQQLMQHRQAQQAQQAQRFQTDMRYRQMMQQQVMNEPTGDRNAMNFANASNPGNGGRDGGLSPTSNQLARWFSPELLAQANAGKLPLLSSGQALSLEEFERSMQHSSATVHN